MTYNNVECTTRQYMALDIAYDHCTLNASKSQNHIDPHVVIKFMQESGINNTDIKAICQGILEIMMAFAILSNFWLNYYDDNFTNKCHQWIEDDVPDDSWFERHSHYTQPEYDTGRGTDGKCDGYHRRTYRTIARSENDNPKLYT